MPFPPTPPVSQRRHPSRIGHADALAVSLDAPPLGGNRVTLLEGDEPALRAMEAAIDAARDHVNLDGAMLEAEAAGERLLRRLVQRGRGGLCINLLFDPLGPLRPGDAWHAALREAGVHLCERHPEQRRLMVVDGMQAFVGDAAGSGAGPQALLFSVQGPAVQRLQRLFVSHWQRQAEGAMQPVRLFPPLQAAGTQRVAVADAAPRQAGQAGALLCALAAARSRVLLGTGGRAPSGRLARALAQAAQRGVRVEVLGPGRGDGRAQAAARQHYGRLLRAGASVYERRGSCTATEACLIDGLWLSTGAGVAARAGERRPAGRADLVVIDEDFARSFEPMLRLQMALAQPVDALAWARRPWWLRLQHAVSGRFGS